MVNDDKLYVCDRISQKIILYSFDDQFVKSIKSEKRFGAVSVLPDGSFLCFTPDYICDGPMGLWIMSDEGKMSKSILKYTEKYPIVYNEWSWFYSVSPNETGIFCPISNRYMRYNYKQDRLVVDLEMNVKQETTSSFSGIDNSKNVTEPYFACIINLISDNYMYGVWVNKGGKTKGYHTLYSKKTGEMKCYDKLEADFLASRYMGEVVVSNLANQFVSYVQEGEDTWLYIYMLK